MVIVAILAVAGLLVYKLLTPQAPARLTSSEKKELQATRKLLREIDKVALANRDIDPSQTQVIDLISDHESKEF